jgi:hypothetical protein
MWEFSRLQSFLQRPNIYTRALLRESLASLTKLRYGRNSAFPPTLPHQHQYQQQRSYRGFLSSSRSQGSGWSPSGYYYNSAGTNQNQNQNQNSMGQCIGIHVRHGDALNDARGELALDRSLHAHVSCAGRLASQLGISNMFLATDNNTLFQLAVKRYPQFKWYAQKRALKDFSGANFDHKSEKSARKEVANLLVRVTIWKFVF